MEILSELVNFDVLANTHCSETIGYISPTDVQIKYHVIGVAVKTNILSHFHDSVIDRHISCHSSSYDVEVLASRGHQLCSISEDTLELGFDSKALGWEINPLHGGGLTALEQ